MRKSRLVFLPVGLVFSSLSFSQSVSPATLNASGGTYIFTNYRFEWSFGESMAIETMSTPNLQVTNGILQPRTHEPANINTAIEWGRDEIRILPNPVQNILEIDFFSKQQGKVTMTLFDEAGGLVSKRELDYFGNGRIEKWDFSYYPSGQYFLKIQLKPSPGSVAKESAFKVQKIK